MEKAIKFKESCSINRSLSGAYYDIGADVALRDKVMLVNDDLISIIQGNMLDSIMIVGDCGRKYVAISPESKNFKHNLFNLDLSSIEKLHSLLSYSKDMCGFTLCEISLLSLYYGDTEVKLTFFNPEYTRLSKIVIHLDERCVIYEVVAEDILGPLSNVFSNDIDLVTSIDIQRDVIQDCIKSLILSVENVGFPVEFLEVGLWSNMSEDATLDSQQSFSNKESVSSGISLISELNNFREMGSHYNTYALCIVM